MSYRESKLYNRAKDRKNLPLQFVSSRRNEYLLFNIRAGVFYSDKARIARGLNSFKNDRPNFYPSCQFVSERIFNIDANFQYRLQNQ